MTLKALRFEWLKVGIGTSYDTVPPIGQFVLAIAVRSNSLNVLLYNITTIQVYIHFRTSDL